MQILVLTHEKFKEHFKDCLNKTLQRHNCSLPTYFFASKPAEALELLAKEKYDFVFGDLNDAYHHDLRNISRFFEKIPSSPERPIVIVMSEYKNDSRHVLGIGAQALWHVYDRASENGSLDQIVRLYFVPKEGRCWS